jgi:hypothetical protein
MSRFNAGPLLTENQFVNRTPTGLGRLRAPQQREDINIQIARSLLNDPNISATHKTRLRGIIAANSPVDRRRIEQLEDQSRRRLGSFFDENQTTADEERQLTEQFQAAFPNSLAPAPRQLRRANEESENVELQLANTADTFGKHFGRNPDLIMSMLGVDEKTGKMDPAQALAVFKMLDSMDRISPQQQSSVKTELSRVDKELEALREDPDLFDEGVRRGPFEAGFLGSSSEAIDRQASKFFLLENLERERAELVRRQQGFVSSFDPPSAPAPQRQPEATITTPAATPQFSTTEPYTLLQNDNPADIARAAQEQARKTGVPVQILDPTTNILYEIK